MPGASQSSLKLTKWSVPACQLTTSLVHRSYGIHVARLAGIPEKVVERAGEILQSLSPHDRLETPVGIT